MNKFFRLYVDILLTVFAVLLLGETLNLLDPLPYVVNYIVCALMVIPIVLDIVDDIMISRIVKRIEEDERKNDKDNH